MKILVLDRHPPSPLYYLLTYGVDILCGFLAKVVIWARNRIQCDTYVSSLIGTLLL